MLTSKQQESLINQTIEQVQLAFDSKDCNYYDMEKCRENIIQGLHQQGITVKQVPELPIGDHLKMIIEYGSPDFILNDTIAVAIKFQSVIKCQLDINYLKEFITDKNLEKCLLFNLNVDDLQEGLYVIA